MAALVLAAALLVPALASAFTPDPAAIYRIESRGNNGIVLTGEKLWGSEPYAVTMHRFFEQTLQYWRFEHVSNGYYKVICDFSPAGEVLTLVDNPFGRYADTLAWTGANNQLWKFIDIGNGWTGLQVKDTGKMLTGVEDPLYPYPSSTWYPIGESTANPANISQHWWIAVARPVPVNDIALPQTGWSPRAAKVAVLSLTANSTSTPTFSVSGPQTLSGTMVKMNGAAGQEIKYNMATCSANLTTLTTPGNYTLSVTSSLGTYTKPFQIANDVYRRVRGGNGTTSVADMLNGFWRWNSIATPETWLNVSVQLSGNTTIYVPTGGNFTLTKGWYDASSRDAKVARNATALGYMLLGYQATSDPGSRAALLATVQDGVDFLLQTQNVANGSWPLGKVKDSTAGASYTYRWDTNTYTGTSARATAALAMAAQVLGSSDPVRAAASLAAAEAGWVYVLANNTDAKFQGPEELSFRGTSGGVLCAAVELFRATGKTAYRDFAETMITNGGFTATTATPRGPAFVGTSTPFPGQVDKDNLEMESGQAIVALCRHRPFASTPTVAAKIDTEAANWKTAWGAVFVFLPWGIPNNTVNQGFGPNVSHTFLALQHLIVAQSIPAQRSECLPRGSKLYDHLTGLNPFSTSFIMGFGNWEAMPGHGRTREDSIGMVQPGYLRYGSNLATTLLAANADGTNKSSYRMTEGMIMESACLFPILALLDAMQGGGAPEVIPPLDLEAPGATQFRLRWPSWASEWKAQQTTTLTNNASWTDITQPVIPATDSDLTTTIDSGGTNAIFFRLKRQ